MTAQVFVYDPTATDEQSKVRGVGRYIQILKENFPEWIFTSDIKTIELEGKDAIFINPFFNPLQRPLIKKKIARRQIVIIHDLIPLKYPSHFPSGIKGKFNIFNNKKTLSYYDTVITDSSASKGDVISVLKIPEHQIQVIYPCLPKIFTQPSPVIANAVKQSKRKQIATSPSAPRNDIPERYCIYVGDATWNKNIVNLAKAIKISDVTCVFVGKVFGQIHQLATTQNPWQKELVEFFSLAKGDPRFIFPGFITDGELVYLYKNARANLLVSRDEGFGFSFIEAASQEVPSLLSDIAVLHEISQDAALFVDEQEPEEIATKIKALVENEDLRQTLGQEAKERSRFFTSDQFKNALDKLVAGIL